MICLEVNKRSKRFHSRIVPIHSVEGGQAPGTNVDLDFSEGSPTVKLSTMWEADAETKSKMLSSRAGLFTIWVKNIIVNNVAM